MGGGDVLVDFVHGGFYQGGLVRVVFVRGVLSYIKFVVAVERLERI